MDKSLNTFIEETAAEYFKIQKDYSSFFNLLKKCRIYNFYRIGYFVGKVLERTGKWEYLDELAICAYWIGEYQESYDICLKILPNCPEKEKGRIYENMKFCQKKLGVKNG